MKYAPPELTTLMRAIDAIQGTQGKAPNRTLDFILPPMRNELLAAYEDWE